MLSSVSKVFFKLNRHAKAKQVRPQILCVSMDQTKINSKKLSNISFYIQCSITQGTVGDVFYNVLITNHRNNHLIVITRFLHRD